MAWKARFPFRILRLLKFSYHPPACSLPFISSCLLLQGPSLARVRMPQFKHHPHPLKTAAFVHPLGLGVHAPVDGPAIGNTAWGRGPYRSWRGNISHLESYREVGVWVLGGHIPLALWTPLRPSLMYWISLSSRALLSSSSHQHKEREYRGDVPIC